MGDNRIGSGYPLQGSLDCSLIRQVDRDTLVLSSSLDRSLVWQTNRDFFFLGGLLRLFLLPNVGFVTIFPLFATRSARHGG